MRYILYVFFMLGPYLALSQSTNYTQYVNPFIGTGGHGHTFPGAAQPFAMVQLSPDTRIDGSWDGCSGYHYSDSIIYGFSHTHLSGTGCSDYGDIAFLPIFADKAIDPNLAIGKNAGISFSHKNEQATAGYYKVKLDNGVTVELTSTARAGIQKYTYSKAGHACIQLDLKHRDKLLLGSIHQINANSYEGERRSSAWAKDQELYFSFELSRAPSDQKVIKGIEGDELLLLFFEVKQGESILIKTALSGVDMAGAKNNLAKEMPDFDFNKYIIQSSKKWNEELSKIKVYGGTSDKKTIFYTALYHCMIHPSIMNDIDFRYRGRDGKIHSTEGKFDYYSVFSLWDTYRALHPLLTLIDEKRSSDFIQTFIKQYEQAGRLPIWELWGNETNCMIGYHAVSVIWDAYNKGIRNFDAQKAYEAMKSIALEKSDALISYQKYGYVRADDDAESVSKTLEYAYDDWCIAQMALALNKVDDYHYFLSRSYSWKNVYDPITGFMRARKNATLYEPFSPFMVDNNYTEANSYQYSFYTPHDMDEYKKTIGGSIKLEQKLDELFTVKSSTEGREQADITGLIGQYAHGNEPSHHIAFLYSNLAKRDQYVHQIIDSFYTNSPDGLIGNEDCGQMSAWYVWASMGLYPVCPGTLEFSSCSGVFDSTQLTTLHPILTVKTENRTALYHELEPSEAQKAIQYSDRKNIVPFIYPTQKIFKDSVRIRLGGEKNIFYSLNYAPFIRYDTSICLRENSYIQFYSIQDKNMSPRQEAHFYKLPNDKQVLLHSTYNPQYHAGGPQGLIDGVHGDINWRKGDWQGYQGQDLEVVIQLDQEKIIKEVNSTFLQDQGSWIFFPTEYNVYVSSDGTNYELINTQTISVPKADAANEIRTVKCSSNVKAKFIKVVAKNYGKLPAWHPGAGGDTFIFIDEIQVSY